VQAGQVLARLDPVDLQLAQQASQASLAAANTQWIQAQADFKRFQTLQTQGFISAAELERRQTALDAALAQRDQAQASSHLQGNQVAHAVLKADRAGVVTAVLADPGTVVAAGTPVLRLAQAGPRDALFSVPEDRVAALRALLGRPGALRVRLGAGPGVTPATLREVAAAADPATRTFLAKADLGDAGSLLNQTANVLLPAVQGPVGTRVLPMVAVAERDGHSVVWLLDPASLEAKGLQWRVQGELVDGAELVTAGLHVLHPGQTVRRYGDAQAAASAPVAR
jgi:multidrug efflux system membrane fusion protein